MRWGLQQEVHHGCSGAGQECHHTWLGGIPRVGRWPGRVRRNQRIRAGTEIRARQVPPAFLMAFSTSTVLKKPPRSQGTLRNPQRLSIKSLIAADYCEDDL